MNMRSEASPSCFAVDEASFCRDLYSMGYFENQSQLMAPVLSSSPSSLQEALISFRNEQRASFPGYPFEYPTDYCQPFQASSRFDFSKFMASQNRSELCLSLAAAKNPTSEMRSSRCSLSYKLDHSNSFQQHSVLSGSAFLHAMQKNLSEIASLVLQNHDQSKLLIQENITTGKSSSNMAGFSDQSFESDAKKKHLLTLLQAVDDQYNQSLDEVHTVISAFHAVTDLDPNLHTRFVLPAITAMYKSLRERISSRILEMGCRQNEREAKAREDNSLKTPSFSQKQEFALKRDQQQMWKPQRGLPERSVSVLRAWMFQNFLHPYPNDAEKHLLALKSGLTRSQVSNWFINARVRLWKPMIEEMYGEMNNTRKISKTTQ